MSYTGTDEEGESIVVRASVPVDGDNLSADYTLEFVGEGAPSGEYGRGQATGLRVVVEPTGTPVGSLEELVSGFNDGTDGTEGTETEDGTEGTDAAAPATETASPTTS